MFKRLLEKSTFIIFGGPYRIRLDRRSNCITLIVFKGKKPIPFSQIVKRHQALSSLSPILKLQGHTYTLSLDHLNLARKTLQAITDKNLEVTVTADANNLQLIKRPSDFEVSYFWSHENGHIEQEIWQQADYFGDGWFATDQHYWQVPQTTPQDDQWLRRKVIEGQEIIEFITKIVPHWQQKNIPYKSHLKYISKPVFAAIVGSVETYQVTLEINWTEPPQWIRDIPSLKNHVIVAETVMPGIIPQKLPFQSLRRNGRFHLRGENIPRFQQEIWPLIHHWGNGNIEQLKKQHPLIEGAGQVKLIVQTESLRGIGIAAAVPTFVCGSCRLAAQKASELLTTQNSFHRVEVGWLPTEVIEQSGIKPGNRSQDGRSLSPIILTPVEVLKRGSDRLQDVWGTVEFPKISLPDSDLSQRTAQLHLQFLKTWGISGGLVGTVNEFHKAYHGLFSTLVTTYPQAQVLVLGSDQVLNDITVLWQDLVKARFNGNKSDPSFNPFIQGIILATPKALEAHPEIIRTEWNILCLLEADSLIKSERSKLFQRLTACRSMLIIGLFNSEDFIKRTQAREAMSKVFRFPPYMGGTFVWQYALRDPTRKSPPLPAPYQVRAAGKPINNRIKTAEYLVGERSNMGALPIPPRTLERSQPVTSRRSNNEADFRIEVTYSTRENSFITEAKRLVSRSERSVRFVPFQQYWPTYQNMTAPQQKWYFYWRSQVRGGRYPDTDLSYIFVHVYELINNVGIKNGMDGYNQLRQLWLNYRERYPNLDHYLIDWIADYVLVNRCPIDPLKIYADETLEDFTVYRDFDLILANYVDQPFTKMPVFLLDKLTDYSVQRSRFYEDGHQEIINEYLPKTLHEVNRHLTQRFGEGIFGRYKPRQSVIIRRQPFQGAVYAGQNKEITLATVLSYSKHQPLRDFLTATVKHTENKLRELKNYKGRLRNIILEPTIEVVINEFIASVADVIVPPPPKPKVEIDLSEVTRLRHESAQVFQMLQKPEEEVETPPFVEPVAGSQTPLTLDSSELQKLKKETEQVLKLLQTEDINERAEANEKTPEAVASDLIGHSRDLLLSAPEVGANQPTKELEQLNQELPPEWAMFASQLTEYQIQVIKAVVTQDDPGTLINQIAEANITMPELLIDEINELAQNTVGDIILETRPVPQFSEDEYLELAQKLLALL